MPPRKRRQHYDVSDIDMDLLHMDETFNCRDAFGPSDVQGLIQSMNQQGLGIPIVIQPARDVEYKLPKGKKFRIICGNRRYVAAKASGWKEIPAMIKYGLTEFEARVLNLTENVERKDINPLEEALAIKALFKGKPIVLREAMKALSKGEIYVRLRVRLLELDDEIQKLVASGLIPIHKVDDIYQIEPERRLEYCELLRKRELPRTKRLTKSPTTAKQCHKRKTKKEVTAMIDKLFRKGINGLPTRLLAWTLGNVADKDMQDTIRTHLNESSN